MKPAATPIIKWAGGKSWLVPKLAPVIQTYLDSTGGTYIEPFLGGGAMALALARPRAMLSDIVWPLIEFYQTVLVSPGEVAWGLSALGIEGVDEENYYRVRDLRPPSAVRRAARFLYLNRLSYNGLYRENKKGEFNVPYGGAVYRKSVIGRSARDAMESLFPNKEKIHKVAVALKTASINAGDFETGVLTADAGDLVFVDPPYDECFNGYSKTGFKQADQERLARELFEAASRGAMIIACNSDTEVVRKLYAWAEILESPEQRRISATTAKSRPRAACVLITNHPTALEHLRQEAA